MKDNTFVAFFVSLFLLVVFWGTPAYAVSVKLLSAKDHLNIGDTGKAYRLTNEVLNQFPNNARAFNLHSKLRLKRKGWESFFRFAKYHLLRTRNDQFLTVSINRNLIDNSQILKMIQWAIDNNITNGEIFTKYGSILNSQQKYKKVLNTLQEARKKFPEHTGLIHELLKAYIQLNKLEKAEKLVHKLIKDEPGDEKNQLLKTIVLIEGDNISEARLAYQRYKALSVDPLQWEELKKLSLGTL